jgi:hypothetical protein
MATIVTRSGKGSPLTNAEVDGNFTNLNTELGTKVDTSSLATVATSGAYADLTGKPALGTVATQSADNVAITGGVITGTTMDSISNHVGADHIHYKVKANEVLAKGNVVKVVGYNAGENAFEVAKVTSASDIAVGVVYQPLVSGAFGAIINTGLLEGVNTSAFSVGTVLYPNTSGGFTSTKPTTGRYQALAFVVRSHANNGTILIEASEPQATSLSQFTNDSGYITGITSSNVTTALGFTPYNATNPAGYITSSALSAYLPLTGGTLTGSLFTSGNVKSGSGTTEAILRPKDLLFYNTSVSEGTISSADDTSTFTSVGVSKATLRFLTQNTERLTINSSGSVTANVDFRAPIFYDSGNTGYYVDPASTSNLNKLSAGGRSMVGNASIFMDSLDANTWYPVTIPIPVARQTTLRIENGLNSNVPSWSTHPSGFSVYIEWTTNGLGWGTIPISRRVTDWREQFTSVQIVGGITQLTNGSTEVIWLRGGANYFFSADCDVTPTVRTTLYDLLGQTVEPRSTVFNDPWETAQGKMSYGTFQANERVTAGTDIRAPIFYDSPNTAFYLDPAGSTSLNAAGSIVASGNITLNNGANRRVRIGSATNYSYDLQTTGDDFQIIEAGVTPRLTIKYPNGNFGVGTTNPAVKFVVSNGGAAGLEIDPNGGIGGGSYIQSYNRSTGSYTPNTNYASTHTWYTGATRRMDLDASGRLLVGLSGASASISSGSIEFAAGAQLSSGYYGRIWRAGEAIGSATYAGLYGMASTYNAYYSGGWKSLGGGTASAITIDEGIYSFSNSNSVGAGDAALTWATRLTINTSGNVIASVDMRAPIFYDTPDTSWFLDPSSTSVLSIARLNQIQFPSGTQAINFTDSSYLYLRSPDGGIRLYLGGADPANYHDNTTHFFRTRGGSNMAYIDSSGVHAPNFRDIDNTAYYINPNAGSNVFGEFAVNQNGLGGIRLISNTGNQSLWIRAGYDGAPTPSASATNVQFQASGSSSGSFTFYSGNTLALTINGDYAQGGGSLRAPIFYDTPNTAFYLNPAETSVLNNLSVNGSTVFRSDWTTRFQSGSDFVDGTLVTTDIPATGWAGDSFVIEITGKTYDQNNPPVKVVAQGYLYNDTIINYSGISYAGNFASYIKVFQDGGVLKFWWPRISYWNSFNVNVMSMDGPSNNTITRNRVTAISNSTEPTGTKKQQINLTKTLKTGDAAGSISGFNNPTTAPTANTIAYRDAAGDIAAREIILSSGLSAQTPTVLVSMYPTTNQMVRTTPAAVAASLQSSIQANATGTWSINVTGNAATSNGLQTRYDGGQRLNPQDYFGQGLGLRVAMTAAAGVWSDTLWINGYSGGDVLNMCALHTSRQATPRMWISSQASNGTSYGTLYEFPSLGYNSGNTAGLYAGAYYDSNNTAYYVDPTVQSYVYEYAGPVTYGSYGSLSIIGQTNNYAGIAFPTKSSTLMMGDGGATPAGFYFGNSAWGMYCYSNGGIYTHIMYDLDNSAYRVDPTGTSALSTVTFGSSPTTGGGGGRIIPSTGSPYSLRQEFGSDNSGWRYGIAKNVSGSVTVLFYVQDNGDCVATGNITAYSDIRIKANVETIPSALDKLDRIRGVTYTRTDMDDKERRYAGVIAQEIEAVLPEAVSGDENAKTVDYNATIGLLIQAVKELRDEVEAMKSRLH